VFVERTQQRKRRDLGVVEHVVRIDRVGPHVEPRQMIAREIPERVGVRGKTDESHDR
jgi:hypothetical protein